MYFKWKVENQCKVEILNRKQKPRISEKNVYITLIEKELETILFM
jgi:hypothetical protein